MATVTFTPLILRGAGTRGVPLIPKSGGGGGDTGLATISNAFSMTFIPADNTVMDVGELPPYFRISPIGIARDNPWPVSAWVSGSGTFLGLPYASLITIITLVLVVSLLGLDLEKQIMLVEALLMTSLFLTIL